MRAHFQSLTGRLKGEVTVPADKSLSHRAVLFAAMAEGVSTLRNVLDAADVRSTIAAVRVLGARIEDVSGPDSFDLRVSGWGETGPTQPPSVIECGNSGTTARLLLGVLAGWDVHVVLAGDESLSRRPMSRVTEPLERMGAHFETSPGGRLPVAVRGSRPLAPIDYELPIASAQVKSALLLAGLSADGTTTVREPAASRDHTERLLPAFGVAVRTDSARHEASVTGPAIVSPADLSVPGDISSAAFLLGAAALIDGSDVILPDVGVNPTRAGVVRVLARMGARLDVDLSDAVAGSEPVGTLRMRGGAALRATTVTADEVPSLIDEIPLLAVVATAAEGTTRFEGVGELRVKESDRLSALAGGLHALGVSVASGPDWLEITGPTRLGGGVLHSLGDHRLAMAWTIAGLVSATGVSVEGFEAVDVSYPSFRRHVEQLVVGGATP